MTDSIRFEEPLVFALKHKDDSERIASQSGGAFVVFSDLILKNGGVVYGCAFDDSFQAVHIRADNTETRNRMRYSKYVQSRIGDTYRNVIKDLENGYIVLFSGTSCQITGLLKYIEACDKKIKGKLYTIDIVCHGVPSPRIWKDYLSWESCKKRSTIKNVVCRNKKKFGWKSHITTIEFTNGRKTESKIFPNIFYGHLALRPSCFKCPYKGIIHPSDITIADYWGIEKTHPEYVDEKGISLVLINSIAGKELYELCDKKSFISIQSTIQECCVQKPLIEPYEAPANREQFWNDYHILCFDEIVKKYGKDNFITKCKWKIKSYLKRKNIIGT